MEYIVTLAGGVGLLISGLLAMRFGLQKIFSQSFKRLLLRLTVTPWRGLLAGIVAAVMMQSSTAVTLLTVGLVSAEYLTFYQSLGIILGANIGTCSTVQLLTLALPHRVIPPLFAACALVAMLSKKRRFAALAVAGLLGMFAGVGLLSDGLSRIAELDTVVAYFAAAEKNPLYGIGGGIVLTFLVQSSSAATGLLMILGKEEIINLTTATYGVYGNNIGSCLSSLLIATTAPLAAKRVAVAHILLNVLGVVVFLPLSGLLAKLATLCTTDFAGQIAVIHTLFNILSSLAILPVIQPFARLVEFLVPGNDTRI